MHQGFARRLGTEANPFADFCVREGRAENEFDAVRVTFVANCKAFAADATAGAFEGSGACTTEINTCIGAPFGTGTGAADCVNENAYASERQSVVDNCAMAVITDSATAGANADCMTINSVGQLDCITTNPYLNRAEVKTGDVVTMAALNCVGNANYEVVRNALLDDARCNADGTPANGVTDARCGTVLAGVCGTGTAGSELAIGTDPFNAKFCLSDANIANYVDQREQLVANCVTNPDATGCTTQIAACIADPFLVDGIAAGVNCDDDRFKVAFQARTITYCGLESKDVVGTLTANISRSDCRAFATVLGGSNGCVLNPFGPGCDNDDLGGAADALTRAQTLRATYCATLGTSDAIRSLAQESVCRGAVSEVCKDDALFDATGTYNCFSDKHDTYNTARETYATTTCSGDTNARDGADCDMAIVEICTTTNGLQTNPWAAACEGDTTAQRLAVVTECDNEANDDARLLNPRCVRTGAANVRTNCILDPRSTDCDDYADGTEPFATERLARYALSCAGNGGIMGGADEALCPEAKVKDEICVTNGPNSRPFAPICAQNGAHANLETYKDEVLEFCIDTATDNSSDLRCIDGTTAMTISSARTMCGGSDSGDNPFGTKTITGFTAMVDCTTLDGFQTVRNTFRTSCRDAAVGAVDFTSSTCSEGCD